jgi:hypothetical protein
MQPAIFTRRNSFPGKSILPVTKVQTQKMAQKLSEDLPQSASIRFLTFYFKSMRQ